MTTLVCRRRPVSMSGFRVVLQILYKRLLPPLPRSRPGLPPAIERISTFEGEQDVAAWLSVQNAAFKSFRPIAWPPEKFDQELRSRRWWSPNRLWLARSDARTAVGTLALEIDVSGADHRGQLHWLAVRPEAQRQGVASALLCIAEQTCLEIGVSGLLAETLADSQAESFYRKRGFEPVSR